MIDKLISKNIYRIPRCTGCGKVEYGKCGTCGKPLCRDCVVKHFGKVHGHKTTIYSDGIKSPI
jgi:hypothetical protein